LIAGWNYGDPVEKGDAWVGRVCRPLGKEFYPAVCRIDLPVCDPDTPMPDMLLYTVPAFIKEHDPACIAIHDNRAWRYLATVP
jgi:hypothetical protein